MPYNSRAGVVRLLAERYDTKSNVNLGGFRSQFQASYVSSHTEELWYNKTVCLRMTIYTYKQDLALNILERLICHETQLTNHSIILFRRDKDGLTVHELIRWIGWDSLYSVYTKSLGKGISPLNIGQVWDYTLLLEVCT